MNGGHLMLILMKMKTFSKGNPTLLHHIKDAIMEWIDGKHEKGLALSTQMVIL